MAKYTSDQVPVLLDDFDVARREWVAWLESHASAWPRARPGKWSVGQHADHLAQVYALFADAFEAAESAARAGTLGRKPWRDPLQAWFVGMLTGAKFPRGGRAPRSSQPGTTPDRGATLAKLEREGARFRALAQRMDAPTTAGVWIKNPFFGAWHYEFPELIRVQAQHTRHHLMLAQEAASGEGKS